MICFLPFFDRKSTQFSNFGNVVTDEIASTN